MSIKKAKLATLNLPRSIKRALVICFDILICVFSVWFSFGLRMDQWGLINADQWWVLVASIAISIPLFLSFGLYKEIFRYVGSTALASMVRAFICYTALFFFIFSVITIEGVPRGVGIIQPLLLFIGIGASRYFMRYLLLQISNVQKTFQHTKSCALIYGAGSAGRQLAAALIGNKEIVVKGFIDDDRSLHGNTINGVMVYGASEIKSLVVNLDISDVLLAIPSVIQSRRNQIIDALNGCGVRVRSLPGLIDMAFGRVRASDLHELDMNDLLGREVVPPDVSLLEKTIKNKTILVTGAGGSIGSELCRQIVRLSPKSLILVESSEHALYLIHEELQKIITGSEDDALDEWGSDDAKFNDVTPTSINIVPCLASVRDKDLMKSIITSNKVETVFHAAAYKHVPLVEQNYTEGIRNNVIGTLNCAQVSLSAGVAYFILISTDKAVRPTNVMGASKRIAELILQSIAEYSVKKGFATKFSMVRFGNVLGSSGSVAPLFSAQIKAGGPITLTHSEVTRYFMTIPEAAQLVIQASSMATGGDVFVLDMGHPIRIYDLAVRMVYLSGLIVKDDAHPNGDIEIKVTGLRPGEKLYEELLIGNDPQITAHPKVMKAHEEFLRWNELESELVKLDQALQTHDASLIKNALRRLVPGYQTNFN